MVTKKKVTEQVPGLQQAPEGGKFVVRKVAPQEVPEGTETTTPGEAQPATYTRELVLVVDGEDEQSVPLYSYDDGTLNNATYQLLALRRESLRKKLFEDNDEVELTP
jgi:hypothetical protein